MREVIEKSLVGLYNKHKGNHTEMADITQFVKSLGLSTPNPPSELESTNSNNWATQSNFRKSTKLSVNRPQASVAGEVMSLAVKVLAFLKISKNEFSDLEPIPALQTKDWQQLGNLIKYLLDKKFVIIRGIDTKVYAQITPFGLQYLHACEATAC
ncbi:hypothetical protein AHMF7605_08730 [Adhaeribacter arboris]|uniref:Uncharacterized protein n=1 Tax=Adhaeribacter arboris TaxID=2072846 RepID=A0A2T2YDM1_9BACT|nr:hypothetical protein [Adhaeribacter arboris]PSR53604.1 hypothetical protein AHMF7605_08730 [Adhaeribacter arboris]